VRCAGRKQRHEAAFAIQQKSVRGVIDQVRARTGRSHFLEKNLVRSRDRPHVAFTAGERDETRMEGCNVGPQRVLRIARRVERNEDWLHLVSIAPQCANDISNLHEIRRANVGAIRVSEIKQHELAAIIGKAAAVAALIRQREWPTDRRLAGHEVRHQLRRVRARVFGRSALPQVKVRERCYRENDRGEHDGTPAADALLRSRPTRQTGSSFPLWKSRDGRRGTRAGSRQPRARSNASE
jgi:hypothetical protein